MAETTENTEQQQVEFYTLKDDKLKKRIDDLFFKWFKNDYTIIADNEESKDTSATLTELTKITNALLSLLGRSKEKSAVELLNNFTAFMAGDATAGVKVIGDRPQDDHISKLMWLINVATTVSVLSGELAETRKTLDNGPLKKANVSANNIEKVTVPAKNSKQMKSVSEFIGDVLPKKFKGVAQHQNLIKAAERRSKFGGKEFKNEPTFDTMYEAIGEALVYVSTSFFAEANRAFTEQGKRLATDKVKNIDIASLPPKEQEKFMQTLQLSFDRNVNYTVELGLLRNLNDKMILDSALCVWYKVLNDQQRQDSGFTENDLKSLPKAIAFSRKFKTQFDAQYLKYSNLFVDGMTAALKKEQEAVEKTWFENKVTGERQFRRGRLAGHGNKFMHTAPMKWLNESLGKKSWASLWAIPKLGMLTLNILTNPTLRKVRKKLTGTLFAGMRSFAQGVAEGFTATGRSTEITYEDVIKKIREAEDKLKKITSEDTVITNESLDFDELTTLLLESEGEEDDSMYVKPYTQLLHYIEAIHKSAERAKSDENTSDDRKHYERSHERMESKLKEFGIRDKCNDLEDVDSSKYTEAQQVLSQIADNLRQFDDDWNEYEQKAKNYTDDARDAESGGTLQVGEKTVAICEDVFDTLNKYIARQWNLLAAHSNHEDMPLCVEYTTIDTPELVKSAVKQQKVHEMTFTDWLNALTEEVQEPTEENKNNARRYYTLEGDKDADVSTPKDKSTEILNTKLGDRTDDQKARANSLGQYGGNKLQYDRAMRDVRDNKNGNNGNTTAKYPMKYGDKYRYHGLEIKAAKSDKSKSGFGILADRLIKIAGPVADFCEYVKSMGHEDAEKTFDNDKKDLAYSNSKKKRKQLKASNVNPLESVFVSGFVLNEDIGNRIVTAADKFTDKAGDKVKSGIKWLGKWPGIGIGKALHGMTHTGTADKDALMAKTGLTYIYDRNLNTAYIVDGAHILKKHCLTKSAESCFDSIAALASALKKSDIANARSISAVAQSLKAFEQEVGQTKFAPCKTIIDYDLAEKINNGGISDNPTSGECMIKGICIRNFDSAKEYARNFNRNDVKDIFAVNKDDAEEAEALSGEAPSTEAPAGETNKPEEISAENNADETSVDTEITSTNSADNEHDSSENNNIEQTVDYGEDKSDTDAQNNEENSTNAHEEKQEQQTQEKPNEEAVNNAVNTGAFKIDNAAYNKIDKTNYSRDQWQQVEKNTNRKERDNITADGKTYVDGKQKKSGSMMKQSTEVDISGLSKLFEEINNIDWKDTLNG